MACFSNYVLSCLKNDNYVQKREPLNKARLNIMDSFEKLNNKNKKGINFGYEMMKIILIS